ncbi:uncharacterized protein LOC127446788 [Myxocyprinus asiaticus]|uniref:uncharacterized protein LOC127446788 n=1 Tax=Myxocyprinus asiaticus TaxID=70543 RepID=UPI002222EFCB|nr:uncharacterized protein LOC127446788 [Myxocyprinus asiaticus]XP_051563969.1 uncharacterized protein LOC127446788 [Myxocyprinus asiaticus]XP_051563977.1 uncharacterized protein LOC127446788 [Myxocyprinus asiaticus]XP_051563987.1 uncharacterized protein LOC127446788 [Myxocyprinus asiaticus]XP_051563997.1 uncharacterized protein LOC127446788 [Myxocyprinus asiaticus]
MADHTSYEPSESLSFAPMFRSETEGQRSSHNLYRQGSMSGLSQFEVSNHLPCETCDGTGSTMNGIDPSGNTAYWGNTSPVSSVGLNRNKAQLGMYENNWSSHCHQQEATESYETTEHQKLDSFSEAFCSQSTSQMLGGEDQIGFSTPPNNSTPPSHALSFPLVLSPPPTPLPPSSFSPPKRHQHFLSAQILSQSQMQTPTDGSLQFFPSLPSPSTGRFNYPSWLQLPAEDNESGNITQHLPQEFSPSLVHSEQAGPHMRQISSPPKDCSLQMSLSSALAQHHHSQSCVQLQLGHEPGTSEDQMTWPQLGQLSHSFGPSLHQSSLHGQESGPGEGSRFTCGLNFSAESSDKPLGSYSTQNVPFVVYTGVPYNSVIQLGRELMENWEGTMSHFTPLPMLNPTRSGTGLFCNLRSPLTVENRAQLTEERKDDYSHRCINIGPEFQAELPDLIEREHRVWPEESVREEMLWKPWVDLEENDTILEQVENLLDLSASSVLPGGGANLELALHSLSRCQGNILAALEMLLFSNSVPSEDYHYSGTDMWTLSEQRLFHKAFTIYGKDFFFIHKMVRTKQVLQCVEYYYNSKRLSMKQRKKSEREKVSPSPKMLVNQANIERQIHTQPLPTSFPCKQCGKMFYKIKSRNAHMKIHRQQQEDWKDKLHIHSNQHHNLNITRALVHANQQIQTQTHHQNHILTQSLIQNLVQSQTQLAFLQSRKTPSTCSSSSTSCMAPTQNPQIVSKAPPLQLYTGHHQTWGSQHSVETGGLFYN